METTLPRLPKETEHFSATVRHSMSPAGRLNSTGPSRVSDLFFGSFLLHVSDQAGKSLRTGSLRRGGAIGTGGYAQTFYYFIIPRLDNLPERMNG